MAEYYGAIGEGAQTFIGAIGDGASGSMTLSDGGRQIRVEGDTAWVDGEQITLRPGQTRRAGRYLLRGTDFGIVADQS